MHYKKAGVAVLISDKSREKSIANDREEHIILTKRPKGIRILNVYGLDNRLKKKVKVK